MRHSIHRPRRDQRGMVLVFVMGFMGFMAATTLAIDVGMLMTARSQAQVAADAGALAGAVALAFNSAVDQSAGGPAVQSAMQTALASPNNVMGAPVSVTPADIAFLPGPSGQVDRVQVRVFRTASRGNPVRTMIASLFGMGTVDIGATATAEATLANAETCVKPWAIPDKWTEKQTAPWDSSDTFDSAFLPPTFSKDIFKNVNQVGYTGYRRNNVGLGLVIKPAIGNVAASAYYGLNLAGGDYQTNIETCNPAKVQIGDVVPAAGPLNALQTQQGVNDLIAEDPGAYWDAATQRVVSGLGASPRVVVLPVYDPAVYDQGAFAGSPTIQISDFVGFFIESVQADGSITGRIVPVVGVVQGGNPVSASVFPRAIRLVG